MTIVSQPERVTRPDVMIRELQSVDDHLRMQPIMERVWGREFVVPSHLSYKMSRYGGVILGAFVDEVMVGFTLSFPMYQSYLHGLYIHMTAVQPEYQSHSVGQRLRLTLGLQARARGHRMVTWTFDPLEAPNARMNIGKIGAICNEYLLNHYGTLNDNRNKGIETDRFQVQWWVETPRVAMMLEQYSRGVDVKEIPNAGVQEIEVPEDAVVANGVIIRPDGLLAGEPPTLNLKARDLLLRVPRSIQEVKAREADLAHQWRMQTRSFFTHYFARGWTVTGYLPGDQWNTYVLQK